MNLKREEYQDEEPRGRCSIEKDVRAEGDTAQSGGAVEGAPWFFCHEPDRTTRHWVVVGNEACLPIRTDSQ